MTIKVLKRNNKLEDVSFDKITKRIKEQSVNLKVDYIKIAQDVIKGLYNNISTRQIDDLTAETAASYTVIHPDYEKLAANIAISRLHKETLSSFKDTMYQLYKDGKIEKSFYKSFSTSDYELIEKKIDYRRDYNFKYFGYKTLEKSYLLKYENGKVAERPQHLYMRISLYITDSLKDAFELYDELSRHKISFATPIQFNSGTVNPQLASCVLTYNKADSLEGIEDTRRNVARYSADSAGIGLNLDNIRSKNSKLSTSGGFASGIMKQLRIYNEYALTYNQGGKRAGSFAIYLSVFHKDIMELIECKKNQGKEHLRARDLFPAIMIPDLFMKRLKVAIETNSDEDDFTLFCPNDFIINKLTPLHELHGEEFEKAYIEAEQNPLLKGEKIKTKDIWQKICESLIETGTPYILFKDAINRKTNHQVYGTVKQSNLCAEIVQYTDSNTTAICTLASIPVQKFIKDGVYDYQDLEQVVNKATKALNVVINKNKYSTVEGKKGGLEQRAIAIGVQGLADVFSTLKLPFDSEEAREIDTKIAETIYYSALKASMEWAKETNQVYHLFDKSPYAKGILQFQMWGLKDSDLSGRYDWDKLREDIKTYGLSNSLVTANMPTASSAQIIGSNECFEPFTSNLYVRRVNSGEFVCINEYLVRDLESLNLWSEEMANAIKLNRGNIYTLNNKLSPKYREYVEHYLGKIPQTLKEVYKTVFEIPQKTIINRAADRGKFIDQTQSMNLFLEEPTVPKITSMLFYGWEKGLKTGVYYLRSKPKVNTNPELGIDISTFKKPTKEEILACSIEAMRNGEQCDMCSA